MLIIFSWSRHIILHSVCKKAIYEHTIDACAQRQRQNDRKMGKDRGKHTHTASGQVLINAKKLILDNNTFWKDKQKFAIPHVSPAPGTLFVSWEAYHVPASEMFMCCTLSQESSGGLGHTLTSFKFLFKCLFIGGSSSEICNGNLTPAFPVFIILLYLFFIHDIYFIWHKSFVASIFCLPQLKLSYVVNKNTGHSAKFEFQINNGKLLDKYVLNSASDTLTLKTLLLVLLIQKIYSLFNYSSVQILHRTHLY